MITYQQFLTKISNYYQKIGLPEWPPAPVVHGGFPGNFNLSFAEYEFLKYNNDYFDLKNDMFYTKIQPCIRHNDFIHIQKPSHDSYRYLLRFNMAGMGLYWKKDLSEREKCTEITINNLLNFLLKECGFEVKNIYVQYLKSAPIRQLTEGKYDFDFYVPDDPNLHYYKKAGVPEGNFLPVQNRDGFLALNVYGRPTPWGYRNEIFYKYKGRLLDVGTFESLVFEPIFDENQQICGLKPYNYMLVVSAIGVERVLMVINGLSDVNQLEIISEPAAILRPYIDPLSAIQLIQTLRTIQLIVADGGIWGKLSKRQRQKIKDFYSLIDKIITANQIPIEVIARVLQKIAQLEPNLPQLKNAIGTTIQEYELYKLRKKYSDSYAKHLDELPEYNFTQ